MIDNMMLKYKRLTEAFSNLSYSHVLYLIELCLIQLKIFNLLHHNVNLW